MSGYAYDTSQVYPLGPCNVYIGTYPGVNLLGHTDENGVKVGIKGKIVEPKVSMFGESAVNGFLDGQQIEADFVLMQTDMTILSQALTGATMVQSSGGNQKLTFGQYAAEQLPNLTWTLVPLVSRGSESAETPVTNFTFNGFVAGDVELAYEGGKWVGYKIKVRGVVNYSAGNGAFIGQFGDATITESGTTPSVSSITPAQGATGVSLTASIVATFNEALNPATVSTATVYLATASSPAGVAGTVALDNDGSSTTITFTPASALTASTEYVFVLTEGIADNNGNHLATSGNPGYGSTFTTTT